MWLVCTHDIRSLSAYSVEVSAYLWPGFFLFILVMVAAGSLNARLTGLFHGYQNGHALSQIKFVATKISPNLRGMGPKVSGLTSFLR